MDNNKTINGIDVSEWELKGVLIPITECKYFEGIGDCKESKGLCVDNDNCYFKQFKRLQQELDIKEKMLDKFMIGSGETLEKLQQENEKIKKQYNCYACGNCNGKEDYINLEKHHKGLRKQFDELVKRNNTLSLRIEELEKEKEELKKYYKGFVANCRYCDEWYMDKCNYIKKDNKYKQAFEEIKEDLEQDTTCESRECGCDDYGECLKCVKETMLDKINEVLNDIK